MAKIQEEKLSTTPVEQVSMTPNEMKLYAMLQDLQAKLDKSQEKESEKIKNSKEHYK